MADAKVSALAAVDAATALAADLMYVARSSPGKSIRLDKLLRAALKLAADGSVYYDDATGTFKVRRPAGAAGTDEVTLLYHATLARGELQAFGTNGEVRIISPNGGFSVRDASGNLFFQTTDNDGGGNCVIRQSLANFNNLYYLAGGSGSLFTNVNGLIGFTATANATTGNDTGFARAAAGVVKPCGAAAANAGWLQNTAGRAQLAANATNATATMANLADLTVSVTSGRKYSFKLVLFVANSVAAEGVKIDFDGGSATMTNFRCHATLFDTALLLSTQTTAIATDVAVATCTGDSMIEVYGTFEPSADGTFIPRAAENAHAAGTLTVYRGSNLWIEDMP